MPSAAERFVCKQSSKLILPMLLLSSHFLRREMEKEK
jgi:hypothetical protein